MKCQKCGEEIILEGTKFCPNCGAKIEAPIKTPNVEKTFVGVRAICLNLGNRVTVTPSLTPETRITIEAPEEIKEKLEIDLSSGVLTIDNPVNSVNGMFICGGNVSVSGMSICNNLVIGKNKIIVNGKNILSTGDEEVVINISAPVGVDISVESSCDFDIVVGDLKNKISLDTSGSCTIRAACIVGFDADISGNLSATIVEFAGGRCNLDVSGNCHLTIPSGEVEKMTIDTSGNAKLDVNAQVDKAILDVSGNISGTLRADIVRRDVSGNDRLTIIR